jgi:DNA-binding NarL/FixJ family response regulator
VDRRAAEKARREVARICHAGLDVPGLAATLSETLRRAIPFDGWCWHTIDPATAILTSAIRPGYRADPRFARYEYTVPDVNKYSHLARGNPAAGILSDATHGMLQTSPRYRDLLGPLGIEHELRASFVTEDGCLAACAFYRGASEPDFSTADAELLISVSRVIAHAFKRALLIAALGRSDHSGPGIVLLDDDDKVQSISVQAEHWIDDLVDVAASDGVLPSPVYAVAARARAAADRGDGTSAFARVITRSGRWVTLSGSRLKGAESLTAVILEAARAAEIAPLIVHAYGLTTREQEIAGLVLRGLSTKDIAEALHLSTLTIQDHLKSIFMKTDTRSRGGLVARVFLDHYEPRLARADVLQGTDFFA